MFLFLIPQQMPQQLMPEMAVPEGEECCVRSGSSKGEDGSGEYLFAQILALLHAGLVPGMDQNTTAMTGVTGETVVNVAPDKPSDHSEITGEAPVGETCFGNGDSSESSCGVNRDQTVVPEKYLVSAYPFFPAEPENFSGNLQPFSERPVKMDGPENQNFNYQPSPVTLSVPTEGGDGFIQPQHLLESSDVSEVIEIFQPGVSKAENVEGRNVAVDGGMPFKDMVRHAPAYRTKSQIWATSGEKNTPVVFTESADSGFSGIVDPAESVISGQSDKPKHAPSNPTTLPPPFITSETSGFSAAKVHDPVPAAPGSDGAPAVAARVTLADLPSVLTAMSTTAVDTGESRVTLRLHPEHLGEVRAEITVRDGICHVRLLPVLPAAHDALSIQADSLRDALTRQGLTAVTVEVSREVGGGAAWNSSERNRSRADEMDPLTGTVRSVSRVRSEENHKLWPPSGPGGRNGLDLKV